MRIALVAPSAVPFTPGGAERLWWGITNFVNGRTPHALDLIKLPSPERNLWEIAASYRAFAALDLAHFDMVISTKYPAWMVRHDNHVVYVQHLLRGLYDTYPAHLPLTPSDIPAPAAALWALVQRPGLDRSALPEIFERLDELRTSGELSGAALAKLTAFPGPFTRAVVHALDRIGLARSAVRRYLAISDTVARRADYFPEGVAVEVVPHPPDLVGFHTAPGEFVFTASRLDGAKRIELIVRAYRRARTRVPLVIAGEGPALDALRAAAGDDSRIRFVGRLADADLLAHYARAHFVAFVPYQEDMGLITLEAMKSGKPVLTVDDAGGVVEFVRDGVNGRVVAPEVDALAAAIDGLLADPGRLARMGQEALATGAAVTWERTIGALLGGNAPAPANLAPPAMQMPAGDDVRRPAVAARTPASGPRILVLNTYPVYPPNAGGKKRLFHLYQAVADRADVTLLNLAPATAVGEMREFSPRYREVVVPADARFEGASATLHRALGASVTDIAALLHADAIPALAAAFVELAAGADVVVSSHVYLAPFIARHWGGELWYDAQNVEADMKADVLGLARLVAPVADETTPAVPALDVIDAAAAVARVAATERDLIRRATRVLAASDEDLRRFAALYGRDEADMECVPNGVCPPADAWLQAPRRAALKASLGFADRPCALFVASDHGPNREAAEVLVATAQACPEWAFWVAGSIGGCPQLANVPPNVYRLGVIGEAEITALLRAADAGVNPMLRGSGTNLKMLDYAAHGALALSTEVGARGLRMAPGTHYLPVDAATLPQSLRTLLPLLPSPHLAIRTAARAHVEAHFSWTAIAQRVVPGAAA
jgi:glycosyltransferase involved in cell wall biosynthesis